MKHGRENVSNPAQEGATTNRPDVPADGSLSGSPTSSFDASYQEMIECAQCLVMRMDGHGLITYLNPYTLAFLARERDTLLNANVVGLIVPDTLTNREGLKVVLSALKDNPEFRKHREELEEALKNMVSKALPDFLDAWGLLAMYSAANGKPEIRGILVTTGPVLVRAAGE